MTTEVEVRKTTRISIPPTQSTPQRPCDVNPLLIISVMLILSVTHFFWTANLSCSADSKATSLSALLQVLSYCREHWYFQFLCSCPWGCIPECWCRRQPKLTLRPSKMLQTERTVGRNDFVFQSFVFLCHDWGPHESCGSVKSPQL